VDDSANISVARQHLFTQQVSAKEQESSSMTDETVSATTTISTSAETVFAALADPSRHAAIDGTGWVSASLDSEPLTGSGQVFRMSMYHDDHPVGSYEIHNLVLAFELSRVIAWKPGYVSPETGEVEFGGWTWRYDLTQLGPDRSEVTLSYDWSAVGPGPRDYLDCPPFAPNHLDNSLSHLAGMVTRWRRQAGTRSRRRDEVGPASQRVTRRVVLGRSRAGRSTWLG
jgi:hypothetical protein